MVGEGTPLHGDRSAWDTEDFPDEHARDINDAALLRHLPAPSDANEIVQSDGSEWSASRDVSISGDLTFVGTDGALQFAQIYVEGIDVGILLADQDVYVQVVAFSPGGPDGVDGNANGAVPDVSNDHITIVAPGMYFVSWHVSCYSAAKNEYEFEIFINNGDTGFPETEAYRTTSVASAVGAVGGSGICDFAVDDTVELWVERKDGGDPDKTLTMRQASISIVQIGGT